MGDFADDALSRGMDEEEDYWDFRLGKMSTAEAFERGIVDSSGFEYPFVGIAQAVARTPQKTVTCRHCGTTGLRWAKTPKGWRTADNKGVHQCPAFNH